ncbi:MAG TPA: PQQ-binding-like beta-propeller repeat protein [Armatimonadota bacterium]|jgi:outer membrane protein assembly factor BamB
MQDMRLAWAQAATRVALIAAIFSVAVGALLLANSLRLRQADPFTATALQALKTQQRAQPANEALKTQIRQLDARLRTEYFFRQQLKVQGGYLLLGGLAVFLLALRGAQRLQLLQPRPTGVLETAWRRLPIQARRAVAVFALLIALSLAHAALHPRPELSHAWRKVIADTPNASTVADTTAQSVTAPPSTPQPTNTPASTPTPTPQPAPTPGGSTTGDAGPLVSDYPTPEEISKNWPVFRGPGGRGIADGDAYPTAWDSKSGMLWQQDVPLPGQNSPVIWGNAVFLSGADAKKRAVFCFDAETGRLRWQQELHSAAGSPHVMDDTGYAAPTMAVDGKRCFAAFANGDVAAFTVDGQPLWTRNLGTPDNVYGHATSLTFYRNLLLVQFDQGSSAEDKKSALLALNVGTGKTVWQVARPVANSWSTPILITSGGAEQLVTTANPWVIAYNPANGTELWRADCLSGDVAPSPTFAGGLVFACNAYASLAAIRPDGQGDVTKNHIAWTASDGLPDIISPVSDCNLLFLLTSEGMVTCYEVSSGKKVWEQQLEGAFHASPTIVGKQLYLWSRKGVLHRLAIERAFHELGVVPLGEDVSATPAFLHGRIYLRAKEHLYCIGAPR